MVAVRVLGALRVDIGDRDTSASNAASRAYTFGLSARLGSLIQEEQCSRQNSRSPYSCSSTIMRTAVRAVSPKSIITAEEVSVALVGALPVQDRHLILLKLEGPSC
jgi:hypothetical protein